MIFDAPHLPEENVGAACVAVPFPDVYPFPPTIAKKRAQRGYEGIRTVRVSIYKGWKGYSLFFCRALVRPSGLISPTASKERLVRAGPTNS